MLVLKSVDCVGSVRVIIGGGLRGKRSCNNRERAGAVRASENTRVASLRTRTTPIHPLLLYVCRDTSRTLGKSGRGCTGVMVILGIVSCA